MPLVEKTAPPAWVAVLPCTVHRVRELVEKRVEEKRAPPCAAKLPLKVESVASREHAELHAIWMAPPSVTLSTPLAVKVLIEMMAVPPVMRTPPPGLASNAHSSTTR